MNLDVSAQSGADIQESLKGLFATSPAVVARLKAVLH